MTRSPAALPGWLLAELTPTLQLATVLTGSPDAGATLVAEALAADPSWADLETGADPHPRLRTALVRVFLQRPDASPGWVAAVLRDGEQLTTAEIATIMDRPVKRVATELVAVPVGSDGLEMLELQAAAPPAAAVEVPYRQALVRDRQRRRRRRGLVGLGLAVVAATTAVVVMLPMIMVRLYPPEVRRPDEWRFTHVVDAPDGWRVTQRVLTQTTELTIVAGPPTNDPSTCMVGLFDASDDPTEPGSDAGRAVRVGPWSGRYHEGGDRVAPEVIWSYAPGRLASVACPPDVDEDGVPSALPAATVEQTVLALAEDVRFEDSRVRLPFTLISLPESYRVDSVSEVFDGDPGGYVDLQPGDAFALPGVSVRYGFDEAAQRCLGAEPGQTDRRGLVCLDTQWASDDAPGTTGITRRTVDDVERRIRLAPDLTDRTTWFDAIDLPH